MQIWRGGRSDGQGARRNGNRDGASGQPPKPTGYRRRRRRKANPNNSQQQQP